MQTFKKIVSKITNESIFLRIVEEKPASQEQYSQAVQ